MKTSNSETAVVYLAWLPYGIGHFRSFIESYLQMPSGADHKLILAFNGTAMDFTDPIADYLSLAKKSGILVGGVFEFESGQDLTIYRQVASRIDNGKILFFNTFTRLLAPDWLRLFLQAFEKPGAGLVGATASLQSYYSSVFQKHPAGIEPGKGWHYHFRKYKLFVKAFIYWRWLFSPFPSPHIRTNAFMVDRLLFLGLWYPDMKSKFDAYRFESGRNSMTAQIKKMGKDVLVVDKHGKCWSEAAWKDSFTFWRGVQENLLVSDNQTTIYETASPDARKEMTRLAWGIQ